MYQITVESINKFKRVEWSETVEGKNQSAATRKANLILKDVTCTSEFEVKKHINQYDEKIQIWQLV